MLRRLLIANRGEIALRIARACRELHIEVVAAYSTVDENLLHLRYADDSVCIGETSYLDAGAMLAAATSRGCDAVHPGYGMLAERPDFARAVEDAGLTFVGPRAETISVMGDKVEARRLAADSGLEVLPGSDVIGSMGDAAGIAAELGYPVLLKALAGGGGRGMRIVRSDVEMAGAYAAAEAEAAASFGDGSLYLEKYLSAPRHIEVQVLGDGNGAAVHLGTRECSIQRRHQKIVEEAPAIGVAEGALGDLLDHCIELASSLKYRGAGTLEFLYQDANFYFIEMNTRIQVEHPVTEMITGRDLVRAQLEIADDAGLPFQQDEVRFEGHAIECRVNAETGDAEAKPSPGLAYDVVLPGGPGVRVDSHLYSGYLVPHHYDSLIAKIIVLGASRPEAIVRLNRAIGEFEVRGISSNIPLLRNIVADERFHDGNVDTRFLERLLPA